MTFDLTPSQTQRLSDMRALAARLAPMAATIDATGRVPDDLMQQLERAGVWADTALDAVLALEALAAASGAAAARVALGAAGTADGLAGLRGLGPVNAPSSRQQLAMAAVCLGLGRAALDEALGVSRQRGDRPGGEPDAAPHWMLADAATEMDAARLLVHAAADGHGPGAAAALVFAGGAAARAVEAALRIVGAEGYRPGSVLERCSRDVRAAQLLFGTEDRLRRQAADALLG
ncbi:MAG: acyl-CoA dehydrogenase family protein [Vicinamibacterales bacterium]